MYQCCCELWWASRAGGGGGQNKRLLSLHPRTEWKPLGWLGGAISMRTMLAAVRKLDSAPFRPSCSSFPHLAARQQQQVKRSLMGSSGLFKEQFGQNAPFTYFCLDSEWNLDPETTHWRKTLCSSDLLYSQAKDHQRFEKILTSVQQFNTVLQLSPFKWDKRGRDSGRVTPNKGGKGRASPLLAIRGGAWRAGMERRSTLETIQCELFSNDQTATKAGADSCRWERMKRKQLQLLQWSH